MFRFISLKCPACAGGRLFQSYLRLKPAESCESCGVDFKSYDVGDAPQYFSVFLVGIIIPVFAVLLDSYAQPPYWVHILIWVPATILFSYLSLIYIRAAFMHLEYKMKNRKR